MDPREYSGNIQLLHTLDSLEKGAGIALAALFADEMAGLSSPTYKSLLNEIVGQLNQLNMDSLDQYSILRTGEIQERVVDLLKFVDMVENQPPSNSIRKRERLELSPTITALYDILGELITHLLTSENESTLSEYELSYLKSMLSRTRKSKRLVENRGSDQIHSADLGLRLSYIAARLQNWLSNRFGG